MSADVRTEIHARYGQAFDACEQLAALEQGLRAKNPIHADSGGRLAVVILQAKARKTFNAILVLARDGYGEDALILARSLTNLCIDLAFMTVADTPKRVRAWLAYARLQLRKWAAAVGRPLDTDSLNWSEEEELAKNWLNVADRAVKGGTKNFYDLAYRHGSIYEHSDAASFESFMSVTATGYLAKSGPSETMVPDALIIAATALAEVTTRWAVFFSIELGDAHTTMRQIVEAVHSGLPELDKSEPVVLPGYELNGTTDG